MSKLVAIKDAPHVFHIFNTNNGSFFWRILGANNGTEHFDSEFFFETEDRARDHLWDFVKVNGMIDVKEVSSPDDVHFKGESVSD